MTPRKAPQTRVCGRCGGSVARAKSNARYCSNACKQAAYRRRQARVVQLAAAAARNQLALPGL